MTPSPTKTKSNINHPIVLGQVGHELLINFKFVLRAPWSACRLCGAVYQTDLDRKAYELCMQNDEDYLATYEESKRIRAEWVRKHERAYHSAHDIAMLEKSGFAVTPEAAHNLAPYGIIPVGKAGSVYLMDEVDQAMYEAPRAPYNDADG